LHAKYAHPRLTENPTREEAKHLDTGSICHALILEGENVAVVIDAENYRTKAAQEARDAARAEGKYPILKHELTAVHEMAQACLEQCATHEDQRIREAFYADKGKAEQTLIWQEDNGVWCRCRPDWMSSNYPLIIDYKTSGRSARPSNLSRVAASLGWPITDAFYRRGFKAVFDVEPDYLFCCQETDRPYALSILEMSPADRALGDAQVEVAIDTFGRCLKSGIWPGYSNKIERITSPPYVEMAWMEHQMEEQ
jgi:hypothetical protein